MRTITFGVACSLDHFIARENHAVDWLYWSEDVSAITSGFWKSIDTVLMGRKTYEVARQSGLASYPGVKNYVFSRTMKESLDPNVKIISHNAAEFVRDLKNQAGKGICVMGGGEFAKALFEATLIDEIGLNVHPVLLGRGVPLFLPFERQIDLELLECKVLQGGCVYMSYRVRR